MTNLEAIIGLPEFQLTAVEASGRNLTFSVEHTRKAACPHCSSARLRTKDTYRRRVRHESLGERWCVLEIKAHKFQCRECGRYFRQQFPGVLKHQRSSEPFRRYIFQLHWDGINRSRLGKREGIGHATVERYFEYFLGRKAAELEGATCPRVLGIDEHFFSHRHGFATTFCDLAKHKVYDVVLGRSEKSLENYLRRLKGREKVRIVCMDLSSTYRALVRKFFPNAMIVADRFHVIRLIRQQFMAVWRLLDPTGAKNRGLLSLMRRHSKNLSSEAAAKLAKYFEQYPALGILYEAREQICQLLLVKHRNAKACRPLARKFLAHIEHLATCGFAPLESLGETLRSWKDEIGRMWRFTRSNGITEGFHTKMEVLQRQAYGFRNFKNYRLRVVVMCS